MVIWSGSDKKAESYYRGLTPAFPIPNVRFRHFRFRVDGRFKKIKERVRTADQLKEQLVRHAPQDAYYTTSCFLTPEKLGPKALKTAMFLYNDLVFDLDVGEELGTLEDVRKQTLSLLKFLDGKGVNVRYIAFSGSKGFHVVCDNERIAEADPDAREEAYKEANKAMVEVVDEAGIVVDAKTTIDTRRIFRIPGTINMKTGYVCTVLSREELARPVNEILKRVQRVYYPAPRIPFWGDERPFSMVRTIFGRLHRWGARSPPTRLRTLVSSRVPGTDLSVVILKHFRRRQDKHEKRLKELQTTYKLPSFYVLSHEDALYSISLKPLQRERMLKVLKAADSLNLGQFAKYGLVYMPVGRTRDTNMKVLSEAPELAYTVLSNVECKLGRAHGRFLAELGMDVDLERCVVGKEELFLRRCVYSDAPG